MTIVLTRSSDGSLTLPAELLEGSQNSEYAVRAAEYGDLVLSPMNGTITPPSGGTGLDEAWDAWFVRLDELSELMGASWPEGLSAVDAVNAIRR